MVESTSDVLRLHLPPSQSKFNYLICTSGTGMTSQMGMTSGIGMTSQTGMTSETSMTSGTGMTY